MKRVIVSKATMCLSCHTLVNLIKGEESWRCPRCGRLYPFIYWKIKALRKSEEDKPIESKGHTLQ